MISNNIAELRKRFGYSQQEVADKLDITRQTYIKLEKDDSQPTTRQLSILADLYGVPVEEFFYGVQNIDKFKQMYLYILSKFSKNGLPKTKLAKLLYLSDFRHYYETFESMSGVLYRCKEYGPLADPFLELTDDMLESGEIKIDCLSQGANMISIKSMTFNKEFDLLSKKEKKEIDQICELWKDASTLEIVNYTHNQKPWMACRKNEVIPYSLILQENPDHVYTPIA